jgi:PAS domain S-box-containing protein
MMLSQWSPLTNEHVRRALDSLLEGCQVIGPDFRYLYLNAAAARHGRRTVDELLGKSMEDIYPGIRETAMFGDLRRCMFERKFIAMENEFRYPDGSTAWFELRMEPVPDGVFILSIDITERRKASQALRDLATRYQNLLEASFDSISVVQDGLIREANAGFLRLFGYDDPAEVIGRPALDFVAQESRREVEQRILDNLDGAFQLIGIRRDGRKIFLEATSRNDIVEGRPARIGAARDLTAQRDLERQFRQAQKMEAVGRLAGGVAHDFNNLLTVIIGHTDMLLRDSAADPARESLTEVRAAAQSAAELTKQLLAFSRQQVTESRPVEVDSVVQGTDKLIRRLIGEDIQVIARLAAPGITVSIDPHQLEQVILNLAVNARDAMPNGGTIAIETSTVDLTSESGWGVVPGQYVLLAVSDTGTGMDPITQERIFEPFFTTKEAGKGTGLGLSIAYGVVKQAGGRINVYSEPDMGTVFRIYLPLSGDAQESRRSGSHQSAAAGTETILVVEDSSQVREIARRVLVKAGYRLLVADSPTAAQEIMSDPECHIDLLLTDLVMPLMSGRELAERFMVSRPRARVLFMSGYTDDVALRNGVTSGGTPYLQKPFTPAGLASKVRETLDAER